MKTFTTTIYNNPNPIGFDLEAYSIQVELGKIPWMHSVFGVANVMKRQKSEGEAITSQAEGLRGTQKYDTFYPQGRFSGVSYDLTFNDTYPSRAFFLSKKTDINPKTDTWNWIEKNVEIAQHFGLIIHANLDSLEIDTYEQLKSDILYVLNNCPKLSGIEIFEEMEDVWKEFTITPEINGVTRFPNYCIRIEGILTYLEWSYNGAPGYDPGLSIQSRSVINWKVCQVICFVVDIVDPSNVQILGNGDIIPIEYVANLDGTVTIPYLVSVNGITLLSRFMLNNEYFQGTFFIGGRINTSRFGVLGAGDILNFDASLPVWSET